MVKSFALSQLDADCARSVGLQPDQLSVDETEFLSFHEIIIQPNLQSYLCCRNYLIRTFVENSNEFVDVEQGLTMEIQQINKENPNILITARDFLDRYRYINYGLLKMPSTTDWKNVSPKRITVIGAGLAGIVAAREIHNLFTNCRIKTDITVLDRRQRLGGKHFTFPLSSNFEENGQPCVDLGSKKIYGAIGFTLDRGRMSQIISQLGLEKMKISKPDHRLFRLYDIDGSLIHADVIRGAQEFLYGVMERASTVHIYEIEELLQKHELYPLLHDTHIRILQWLLADLEADLADGNDATGCSPRIILPGGSGQIIHGLAYGLNEDDNPFRILARKEVTNLNFENNDSVLVGFGSKDFIEADAVVLAISEHELIETITFNPSSKFLITGKSAIDPISPTIGNKIVLVFPRIFWPVEVERFGVLSFEASSEDRGEYFSIENLYKSTGTPCLKIDCSGYGSLEMEEKDDLLIIDEIMEKLAIMFPFECPLSYPIEQVITRWSTDKFCRSLSNNRPRSIDFSKADPRFIYGGTKSTATGDLESYLDKGMFLATQTANFLLK